MGQRPTQLFSLITVLLISGCGLFDTGQERAKILNLPTDESAVVSYTGTVRGAYVAPSTITTQNGTNTTIKKSTRYCAEPPPDVAVDVLRDLEAKLSGEIAGQGSADAELRSKIENKVTELSGRSEVILLTRELLYRQCELFANGALTEAEVKASFPLIVKATYTLAEAERERAKTRLIETSEAALKQEAAESALIGTIVACVSKADGSVDMDVLSKLVSQSPSASSFANVLKTMDTRSKLTTYLDGHPPDTVKSEMAKATQSVQCVT